MASFFDITVGQQVEFQRVLAKAGFGDAAVARVIKDPSLARKMYEVLEPPTSKTSQSWYVSPEQQLLRVKQLMPWAELPELLVDFQPRTPTEVLMLNVHLVRRGKQSGLDRTFDELWQLIEAQDGYTKWRWGELNGDSQRLRLAPGHTHKSGIRWVAFDPNAFHGESPAGAVAVAHTNGVYLAGTEVLMALLLFPDWATSWNGMDSPYPNLSSLQSNWGDLDWSSVPYLDRWDADRQLRLNARWAGDVNSRWASPSVREC